MAKRVFQVAKEIGVTSKVILEKCRAEGLDLKNHMATVSAGLEATLREWFSDSSSHTAVEVAESVDVEEARKEAEKQRRRRKRRKEEELKAQAESGEDTEETPEDADAEEDQAETPEAVPAEGAPVEAEADVAPAASAPGEQEPQAEPTEMPDQTELPAQAVAEAETPEPADVPAEPVAEPEGESKAEAAESKPVPNKPQPPKDIKPAGKQLVPKPAQLQGPRVVRVEKPDVLPTPRRRSPGPRPGPSGPTPGEAPGSAPTGGGPRRGRVGSGGPAEKEEGPRTKRRSPRRKGGRSESGEGLREWRDRDLNERRERLAAASGGGLRRHRATVRRGDTSKSGPSGPVEVQEPITIKDLSSAMGVKSADLIRKLMQQGQMATVNNVIDAETAEMLAVDCGIEIKIKHSYSESEQLEEQIAQRDKGEAKSRPPVVTFLGHVDHGKTSLLDWIRSSRVVDSESGGITQHIGSYRYEKGDRVVTFLDTPGHEAFTQMRARGANMTDVVVLVVAADDGVMPQTIEAINHAKAAEVPIVVALNKIDLPNANVNRVLGQLAEYELQPREWGGQTEVIQTSATKGDGMDDLVEVLSLEAELLELQGHPDGPAVGTVIEAEMDPRRGVLARVLIQDGTLHTGDVILAGPGYGRVRQMLDDQGREIEEAGPATPVEISGLDAVPTAGDRLYSVEDLSQAKDIAEEHRQAEREEQLATKQKITLDNLFDQISSGDVSELPLIVKADVQGSVEVLVASLNKLSTDEVRVKILHAAVGGISASDVLLAEASNAIILGFHVVADAAARSLAEQEGVDVRTYRVIYQLTDEVKAAMEGLLEPEIKEEVLGHAEVRDTFKVTRVGTIAGCYVTDGVMQRNAKIRIVRDNIVIEDDRDLDSLKRFKDDAREVRNGMECGIKIAGYNDIKVGDVLEAYKLVEVAREL